jgi:crotonobetainyl-CoA:carnitine CoA-transferase CaiB-like acyl-CoA transferase
MNTKQRVSAQRGGHLAVLAFKTADVLVEKFRPSVPARLGINYPRLKAVNSRLVYCGLTGYGDSGPLSEKGGFDQVLQCLSGMEWKGSNAPVGRTGMDQLGQE